MAITGADIINSAEKYKGVPYFEGNPQGTPAEGCQGFDCSGLVQRAMSDLGMQISRTTDTQLADAIAHGWNTGTDLNSAQQGDILHYVGHEEIWLGGGQVFSEAVPGTVADVRARTPWPIIGIVRYADAGPGGAAGGVSGNVNAGTTGPSLFNILQPFENFLSAVTNPGFWARVAFIAMGALLLFAGLMALNGKSTHVIDITSQAIKKGADIASTA